MKSVEGGFFINICKMVKLQNATQQVGSKKTPKDKIAYKNQKRQTRNRLIYLVCLHLLYIFIFVGLLCL